MVPDGGRCVRHAAVDTTTASATNIRERRARMGVPSVEDGVRIGRDDRVRQPAEVVEEDRGVELRVTLVEEDEAQRYLLPRRHGRLGMEPAGGAAHDDVARVL